MTDLVHVPATPAVTASNVLELAGDASRLVDQIHNTSFVPKSYRGKPHELLAAVLTGYELGLPPMTAIAKVHNIEGTASLSAEVMRALVLSKGHDLWIEEASDVKVIVGGRRAGSEHTSHVTWTIDMAKTAGLVGKQNWRKHPQQMLLARATAQLCRTVFPDCLAGISHAYEEVLDGEVGDEFGEPVAVGERPEDAPAPKPAKRTRKAPVKKAAGPVAKKPAASGPMADFEQIESAGAPAAAERPVEERRAQMLAIRMREVCGDLDRDDRLALYAAGCGRIVKSGKDLGSDDVDAVLGCLDRVERGELRVHGRRFVEVDDDGVEEAVIVDSGGFGDGDEGSWPVERWQEFLVARGVSSAKALMEARKVAKELGRELPSSLEEFAAAGDQELAVLVRAFVEGEAEG